MRLNKKMGLLTYASLVLALASPVSSTVMAANSTSTKISTSKKVATNNQATTKRNSIVGQSLQTSIDVTTGWNIVEDSSDNGNQFMQGNTQSKKYIVAGVGDMLVSWRNTTAKKVIPMKKGHIYNLDLIYFDEFYTDSGAQVEGYIDFNGDKKLATESSHAGSPQMNSYKKTITPTEDMDYIITIHVTSDNYSSLSFQVGHLNTSDGITDKSGMVTSKYVDEQGNKIADDDVQTGNFGDPYVTKSKSIAGYAFKEVQGSDAVGTFEDTEQVVTFVYRKDIDQSSISGQDVTKYVGDAVPDDSEFKASATDHNGVNIGVTLDKSKVDMTKAGDYDVVITADNGQTKTVQVHVLPNHQSISGSDVTKHVGDAIPGDSEFKASATGKDGKDISVILDKSKVDMSKAGDYDAVITADDGQTKTVQVHVLPNQQSIKGSDVTKYVGDAMPADSEFKASATDKDGKSESVTLDKSKVDMSKAGDYDVVITADDGQTKTVQVHVLDRDQAPKDATVIVDYVDQDGNTIAKSDVLTGYAGDKYTTKAKNIDGYELVSAPKNKEGIFVKGTTKVVYSYQKVKDEEPTTPATPNKPEAPKGDSKTKTVTIQKKKLPQTGEAILAESVSSIIGLLALIAALYVVIRGRINKSKNE